jgi:hypothetical protein
MVSILHPRHELLGCIQNCFAQSVSYFIRGT